MHGATIKILKILLIFSLLL